MTSSLAANNPPNRRADDLAAELTSRVCLARPEENLLGQGEEHEPDSAAATTTAEPYLSEPPLDFTSYVARRWSISDDAALELLCGWLRDYQPQGDYSAAMTRAAARS